MTADLSTDQSDWDNYVRLVEGVAGRSITDGRTIDMLYEAYLGGVPALEAADSIDGLEHVSGAVQRVLKGLHIPDEPASTLDPTVAAYAILLGCTVGIMVGWAIWR